jgi:hypothetical protein
VDSGALPNGLVLAIDGTLSGTPAATAGSYNFTIRLDDAVLGSTTRSYTLVVESASMGIAPASLPDATTGVAYSQQLFTTGGTGPYTYAFTGALPTGLTLSTSGLVSGTPTAAGTYAFDVTATDSNGDTAFKSYAITVAFATVSVDPATLSDGTNGTAYSATFTASGGTAPYTYAISGSAPAGLALAGDTLSGTPAGAGSYTFTITATDNFGATGTRSYTVSIASATLVVSPSSLPGATNGVAYSQALSTSGGTAPYTYASTTLPSGLTLSSAGVLSGTPNVAAGSYSFDVTVIDDNGDSTTVTYSLVIGAATIAVDPATLPGGANGAAYNATFAANGGTAPYTYAATGTLPTGLSFSGDTLSGTPTAAGSYTFTITATDANGDTGSRGYTVVVDAATLVVSPSTLPAATNGAAYTQALSTSGGTAPYTYVSTTLPSGLTLSSAGVLSGTPNVAAGSYSFDVTVTDDNGDSTTVTYSLVINAATIDVTPASLPGGTNGAAYNEAFAANGGTAPYTYAHVAGTLPSGLVFNGTALVGTPTAAGSYNFSIEATDANGDKGTRAYTVAILPATIDITPATLPNAANGAAYSLALTATGGTGPYTYALTSGTCPAGMTLSQAGLLSGTPGVAAGSFDIEVTATDANGDNVTRAYTLVVGAATITVTPATLPGSSNGQPYSQDFAATGGTAPYTYALVAGTLPNGLALANGKLAGTPSAAGDYVFTVEATDANGDKGTRAYAVAIAAATIAIAPDALADGTNGTAFSQVFTATGGTAPYTFTLASGALPTGLALAANGTLAGTPTATGDFTFTVEATDANGDTASHAYTMAIAGGDLLTVNPETLPGGNAEEAYAQTLSAIGGNGPYTFAVTEGALPEGLALAADGMLTGTPTDAGETTFTVTATDADGNFGTRAYTLVFAEAIVLDITPGTLDEGRGGSPYEATFGATGGTAPYSFTVAGGTLPPGMTLSSNGTLSGTPTTPGSYTFTVRGEDNLGHAGTRSFTLVIGAALRADPTRDPGVIDSVNEQLNAARRLGELQMSHVFRRIDAPRAPCTAVEGESSESCKTPVEVWATGTRETSFASGLAVVNAFTVGADMQAGPVRIGAALGTGSDLTERASGYRGDVDGKTWMLYGRIALGDTFGLSAVAGRTDVDVDSRRVLTDAGVAVGRRDGDTEFVGVEVSGEWGNGERGLVPYLRWEHARTELGGYAEAANSPLALQFAGVSQRNSAFVLGAEAFHVLRFDWGTLTPKVRVEVRDRNGSSVGQALWYSDAPGTPYLLSVRGVDDRSALAALGLEAAFGAVKVSLEYGTAGSAEDLFEGQAVRLQLRADF